MHADGRRREYDLYYDLDSGVKWYIPACASVGDYLQDFVLNGNVYKYDDFDNMVTRGAANWNPLHMDLNAALYGQGWASERVKTLLHEGYHLYSGSSPN